MPAKKEESHVKVKVEPEFNWQECLIRIDLRDLDPRTIEGLEKAIRAWFKVGSMGGYADIDRAYTSVTHLPDDDVGVVNYLGKFNWDQKNVQFFVDLGTAGDVAIDILFNLCAAFSRKNIDAIRRIWVGYPGDDNSVE